MDPAVQTRLAGLVRSVVVRCPTEHDVGARPGLDLERAALDRPLGEPAGEVLTAGDRGEHLGRCAAEGAVSRAIALERRRHERGQLVGYPGRAEDPRDARGLCPGILRLPPPRA